MGTLGQKTKRFCTVYALAEKGKPELVRYVGQTKNPFLPRRLWIHKTMAHGQYKERPVSKWLERCKQKNVDVVIFPLQKTAIWDRSEIEWIAKFRKKVGKKLLNQSGGPGLLGLKHTEQRKKEVGDFFRGKIFTDEHRQKISKAKRGKKMSPEAGQNMSLAQRGKPRSEKFKCAMSKRLKGNRYAANRKWTQEQREHLSKMIKAHWKNVRRAKGE